MTGIGGRLKRIITFCKVVVLSGCKLLRAEMECVVRLETGHAERFTGLRNEEVGIVS
jgi:hypothetical protein